MLNMKSKFVLVLFVLLMSTSAFAQNVFVNRDFWAAKPSIELIKQKISEGNNLLELAPGGFDGPMWSILTDCEYNTIKFVFDQPGTDVGITTLHHGNTYLMWTAYKANLPVMQMLIEKGAKANYINGSGQSLLMHAAMSGKADPALYDFCIKHGADIKNDRDNEGRSAMLMAISYLKEASFLSYFTSKGLSLNDTDSKGNGMFHYAVSGGHLQVLKDLVAMGVSHAPNAQGDNAFSFVGRGRAGKPTLELLQYLKNLGLDPKAKFANGQNLAHTLARVGAEQPIVQFLVESGWDLSQVDNDGNTSLMLASARGTVASLDFWLANNEINAFNKAGQSALTRAVAYNSPEIVKLLISKGAKTDYLDKEGNDLYYALISGYRKGKGSLERSTEIMGILAASGTHMPKTGKLLHSAIDKDDKDLLAKLLEAGEDINAKDKDGYTVLHYAGMKSKTPDLIKFLIERGANPTIKTELNEGLLDLIAENEVLSKQNLNLDFIKK
jgi:ankyrin repeat protein